MEGEQESGQETSDEAAAIVQLETVDAQTIHGGGGEAIEFWPESQMKPTRIALITNGHVLPKIPSVKFPGQF